MSFLGHILDSMRQEIHLPPEKVAELMHELDRWSTRRKATKREPLSLLGKLFFAVRVVPVGRLFLHRLITLALTVAHLYHRIYLNAEASANITWWQMFLPTWNSTANSVLAADMLLYTDTSGSYGCGAYYKVPGSSTLGNHTNTSSQPSRKCCSQLWQQLWCGCTNGRENR